jgi:hypothetical protein
MPEIITKPMMRNLAPQIQYNASPHLAEENKNSTHEFYLISPDVKDALSDNRSDFTACGSDPVRCRAVARRKEFARENEGRNVWPKILEEPRETVEEEEELRTDCRRGQLRVRETWLSISWARW